MAQAYESAGTREIESMVLSLYRSPGEERNACRLLAYSRMESRFVAGQGGRRTVPVCPEQGDASAGEVLVVPVCRHIGLPRSDAQRSAPTKESS